MEAVRKIGLIGSAGLGKSGAAAEIGGKLGLMFLRSKDIARPILEKYGYDSSVSECVEKFLSRKEIEFEIVDRRTYEEFRASNGFVTDRTTLECFAYALLSVEHYADDEIALLEKICRENMTNYTDLFYFPYGNGWLEENGIRTMSGYFQWKRDMIIRGLLHDWGICYNVVEKDAVNTILQFMEQGNGRSE